jgi:hypothetical protein
MVRIGAYRPLQGLQCLEFGQCECGIRLPKEWSHFDGLQTQTSASHWQ